MAVTLAADVFIPEVIADITTDILFKETLLINSPYVTDGTPSVYRDGGSTLTFPYWDTEKSGLVQDQVETRAGVTPSKIHMGDYQEPVVNKIISFDFSENAMQDILQSANPNQHIAEIVASESQLEIQSNLIAKAEGTNLLDEASYTSGTPANQLLTVDSILRAKMAWGEKAAGVTPGLFVHSKQFTDLAQTDDFKKLGTATTNNAIVQAQAPMGAVAMVHGCLIYILDSITSKGGSVVSITRSGTTATLTTSAPHRFKVGDKVAISGATQTEYNGIVTITGVTATTFTYEVSGSPASPATGSPVIATRYESLLCLPNALQLVIKQGVRAQQHTHAGSVVITQDFKFRYCTTLRRVNPRRVIRFSTR
jgi:hypothetical protein